MKIFLATGNKGKLKELSHAFQELDIEWISQPENPIYAVEETGTTFIENAIIKARHAAKISGMPTIADDSGIIVPSLNSAPGVYSARYAGKPSNDKKNIDLLLSNMQMIDDREAFFHCALVFMRHVQDPTPLIAEAAWHGHIARKQYGEKGFGYDPIFYPDGYQVTAAQMSANTKQVECHRGQAVLKLKQLLKQHIF